MSQIASDLVVVPSTLGSAGAIVFWRLVGSTDTLRLCEAWNKGGLEPDLLPSRPTEVAAIRTAINGMRGTRTLARPLDTRGDWVLKDESVIGNDTEYSTQLRATLGPGGIVITPTDHPKGLELVSKFQAALREMSGPATSAWLVDLVERCNGVALKDTGGVYFIPAPRLSTWRSYAEVVEAASSHVVLEVPAMSTKSAVRAVSAALAAEAEKLVETIGEELNHGDLGIRALGSRQERCNAATAKIKEYEKLLDIELSNLRTQLQGIEAQVVAATLAAEEEEEAAS